MPVPYAVPYEVPDLVVDIINFTKIPCVGGRRVMKVREVLLLGPVKKVKGCW